MSREAYLPILLLAAGGSSRFGSPKQLIPFRGIPLIRYLADMALKSNADAVFVVLGAQAEEVQKELQDLDVRIVLNDCWEEGISTSLRTGVRALPETTTAVMIMLADQPLVTTEHLNAIIEAHQTTEKPIVASSYAGTLGVPVLFARRFFPDLQQLAGDTGAKQIIQSHPGEVVSIPFAGGALDIDTPDDLHHL
jgi:molybdenum cofactor cytidylyltransferase